MESSASIPSSSTAQSNSSSRGTIKRVAFLKGHTDAVLCLDISSDAKYLASGSEDGAVCLHSLSDRQLICRTLLSKYNPVAALAFAPNSSSSSSSSPESGHAALLFAAAGCELLLLALTVAAPPTSAAAAAADVSVLCRREVTDDDIGALAVNRQGTFLAAADDAGDITLFDLSKLQQQQKQQQQQQQQQQQVLQPLRVIKSAHAPLASAVSFRDAKPWQLLTAGMDSRVSCWDFSRGRKCLAAWNMTEMTGISNPGGISNLGPEVSNRGISNSSEGKTNLDDSGHQMWNPPMVHALAVPTASHSSSSSTRKQQQQQQQQCLLLPAAVQKRIVAAARGDGVVAVFDADGDGKPAVTGSSNSSSKKKASSSTSDHHHQHQQQQLTVAPGFHVCLGPSMGGHSVPASAVVFLPLGSDSSRFLVSAGEDGRLLLWDWQTAFRQQQQQQQQQGGAGLLVAETGSSAPRADNCQQQQQQQQRSGGVKSVLADKDHKRKVNALCCVTGAFSQAGAAAAAVSQHIERCLLFVADTSSRICVYEVSVRA